MYESGGRQSLQIAFNILNDGCGGCPYESYPYTAQIPIRIDGKYQTREFKSEKDVWEVFELIKEETIELNKQTGKSFSPFEAACAQIGFFACSDILKDAETQKDIQRYLYCEKFNVPPYEGGYNKQPCLWVEKAFLIRKYLAKLESREIKKAKDK